MVAIIVMVGLTGYMQFMAYKFCDTYALPPLLTNTIVPNYAVHEGSILARYVLLSSGFEKTDEPYLTEDARYILYRADARKLLKNLGYYTAASEDFLEYRIENATFEKAALFHSALQLSTRRIPHGKIQNLSLPPK